MGTENQDIMDYGKTNLQFAEDGHKVNIEDFLNKMSDNSIANKTVEDLFWSICTEGNDEKIVQAINAFATNRAEYYQSEVLEALQNDSRFAKFVESLEPAYTEE